MGRMKRNQNFFLSLILHVPLIQSRNPTQNTPFSSIPTHSHHKQKEGKEKARRRRKSGRRENGRPERCQGSLYLSVRSGGPDVNPQNEPRCMGVAGKSQF